MNSRISSDVSEVFICFCEVAKPEAPDKDGWIIQKYPESYDEPGVLDTLPKFVYPCQFEITAVQHFSFVLTNMESKWTFGYCRHDPKTSTALMFYSYLPWHELFVRLLNTVADLIRHCEYKELVSFLETINRKDFPEPGGSYSLRLNDKLGSFTCTIPTDDLPTIPENRILAEYYALTPENMIAIFASILRERRIVIKSNKLHRLSACVQAANMLIYPMTWQHIFIPILPRFLQDYLLAPMPFIIGVPTATWNSIKKCDIGDIVLLDADTNVLETFENDVAEMPKDVVEFLRKHLNQQLIGDHLAKTFLRALVRLIGGYRDALRFQPGQNISFNETAFYESRPHMRHYLEKMFQLQIFRQFIEERLDMLNSGHGFNDHFELEATKSAAKGSNITDKYNNWLPALFKNVKIKTSPAMRSAVRTVKETGKDVKSAIRSRMKKNGHHQHQGHGATTSTFHRPRPATAESPVRVASTFRKPRVASAVSSSRSTEYVPLHSPTDELPSPPIEEAVAAVADEDVEVAPKHDMDLLVDIQEVLKLNQQCSLLPPVDRTLKPVRSLDGVSSLEPWFCDVTSFAPAVPSPMRVPSRTSHPRLSRGSLSLPISPSTNPFAFSFPSPQFHPTNPFLLTTQDYPEYLDPIKNGGNLVPCSTSTNLHQPISRKYNPPTADLIRLDSTSSQTDGISRENSDDSIKFKTGLLNPVYPYHNLTSNASKVNNNGFWEPEPAAIQSNSSFLHCTDRPLKVSQSCDEQDMNLLREYGIDNIMKNCTDTQVKSTRPESLNPLDWSNDYPTKKSTPSTWMTFD